MLGVAYLNGFAVEKDLIEGLAWLLCATANKDEYSSAIDLTEVRAKMTPQQIAEAERRAGSLRMGIKLKKRQDQQ